jgi:hypothetical protein
MVVEGGSSYFYFRFPKFSTSCTYDPIVGYSATIDSGDGSPTISDEDGSRVQTASEASLDTRLEYLVAMFSFALMQMLVQV